MKNMPKILIVSITKLKIALLIIVQNLVVNNVYLMGPPMGANGVHPVGRAEAQVASTI